VQSAQIKTTGKRDCLLVEPAGTLATLPFPPVLALVDGQLFESGMRAPLFLYPDHLKRSILLSLRLSDRSQ
jgi:hypothetical protein